MFSKSSIGQLLFPRAKSTRKRSRRRAARRETLENRWLLSAVTVTNSSDTSDGDTTSIAALISNPGADGSVSLREAIAASNNTPNANAITFDPSLAGQTITLTQGEYLITNALTITGLPAAGTTLDANYNSRIFDITAAAGTVTLDGLTMNNGQDYDANTGELGVAGAIYSESALTVSNSNIYLSYGQGGAIYALGDVTVANSFIGQSYAGAGIDSVSGAVTVSNSTIYGNAVGIFAEHGPLTVSNSTVVDNSVGIQAGTVASDGPVTIRSSIVAAGSYGYSELTGYTYNSTGTDLSYGAAVPFTVSSSLIGNNVGTGLVEAPLGSPDASGNFIGGPIHGFINPLLGDVNYGGLPNNGGPTATLLPQAGSPALDTGANPDNLMTDQRGVPRTAGAKTDMGAVELQTSPLTPTISISQADHAVRAPGPVVAVAGANGPVEPSLEGVPVTATYYAGPTASGTPSPYAPYEPGTYTVVSNFAGSAEYSAASLERTFSITPAPTTTTIRDYYGNRVFGQNASISVKVVTDTGNSVLDTGTVTLWEDGTPLQNVRFDGEDYYNFGVTYWSFSTNGLSVGTHTLTAMFSGDAYDAPSTSSPFTVVIDQASTTTVAFSGPDPSVEYLAGQPVTLTAYVAVVSPGAGATTGSVTFWDGATLLGAVTVENTSDYNSYYNPLVATFTTDALSIGAHNITASYSGDVNFKSSSSTNDLSVAIRSAETVTVTSSAAQSTAFYGQNVTLTANVSVVDPSIPAPTGTVQFYNDVQELGGPISVDANGNASITTSALTLGNHRITAVYNGNTAIDTSTGALPGTLSTFARSDIAYLLPASARNTVLDLPNAVAVDGSGDLFFVDFSGRTRKLDAKTGIVSIFGPSVNLESEVSHPSQVGLVCDAAGNLYVADPGDNVVEKVSPAGTVNVIAGTFGPDSGESGDGGPATAATLEAPSGLAFDAAGDLFIAVAGGGVIRKIDTEGDISTVAGGGSWFDSNWNYIGNGDGGLATAAVLENPTGVAVDAAGNIYIADSENNAVRMVDAATGVISTIFDGIYSPASVVVDSSGNLFVTDIYDGVIDEVSPSGVVTTVAGTIGSGGYGGDGGPATAALLNYPMGLAIDSAGDLFFADSYNNVIREVNTAGVIDTVVGGGAFGTRGNGGPATDAVIGGGPLLFDSAGNLVIVDPYNNVVREVSPAGIITAVAGNGTAGYTGDGGPATAAQLSNPEGLALNAAGDLFIADVNNNVVREVAPDGVITTVAGNGTAGYSGDGGSAADASLHLSGYFGLSEVPLAVDAQGDLFIGDDGNGVIRKVSAAGVISSITLPATFMYGATSLTTANYFGANAGSPGVVTGLAIDATGNLFIANNSGNFRGGGGVLELSQAGELSVVAGALYYTSNQSTSTDGGPALGAELSAGSLTFDADGNLLIVDNADRAVRSVSPAGIITTVAGGAPIVDSNGNYVYPTGDGNGDPATSVWLQPSGIAVDAAGDLYVSSGDVRRISPSLVVTKDATTTTIDTSSAAPVFGQPITFTVSVGAAAPGAGTPTGNVQLMVDGQNFGDPLPLDANDTASLTTSALALGSHTITAVYSGDEYFNSSTGNTGVLLHGTIKTIAGDGTQGYSGDGGPALNATLNFGSSTALPLGGVAVDAAGDVFIADTYNNVIRKVTPDGTITTFAGNGTAGYSGDLGFATNAQLNRPEDVAVDAAGDLFIVDTLNSVIREVTPNGVINTVAGTGDPGYRGDGDWAIGAELDYPTGVAVDAFGDLFIADWGNSVVREVTPDGVIHAFAGNGTQGYSGDDGPATEAQLISPTSVAVDRAGDLFITDLGNADVREVTPDGVIHTVAGNGTLGYSGDGGPATDAQLNYPDKIAVDDAGNLFISDTLENVIREVSEGVIRTVVGNGTAGYSGDGGAATDAELNYPDGIALDAAGNLFIADTGNNVVREVTPSLVVTQVGTTTTLASSDTSAVFGQSVTFTATVAVVAPGAGAPIGTVTFWGGSTLLATVTLDSTGQASFTASGLSIGTHTIKAVYSGDANFVASASAPTSQDVLSAQQEAGQLADQVAALVDAGVLKNGSGNALIAKLDHAATALDNGHTIRGVIDLVDFIDKVRDLRRAHKLDRADAHALIADAKAAIAAAVETAFD